MQATKNISRDQEVNAFETPVRTPAKAVTAVMLLADMSLWINGTMRLATCCSNRVMGPSLNCRLIFFGMELFYTIMSVGNRSALKIVCAQQW